MAWLMLTPAVVLLWVFTYQPILTTIGASLYSTPRGRRPSRFVGLEHYQTMIGDPIFWKSLTNNFVYAVTTVPLSMAIALIMALFVHARIRGGGMLRLAYFTPTILPMVAVANLWLFFYSPDYGLIDQILHLFGQSGNNWLGNPKTTLGALIAITIWKEAGFFMIFYLAALQQISPSLLEAAELEGASYIQTLRRVVLPLLMPTTLFVSINAIINAVRMIDHVIVLTKGGPDGASTLLFFYVYQVAFGFWDTNYAAALTVVLLAILALAALFQFGFIDKRIHYR
jgi:sn-glycerol 3-phosphate transport system permease protein